MNLWRILAILAYLGSKGNFNTKTLRYYSRLHLKILSGINIIMGEWIHYSNNTYKVRFYLKAQASNISFHLYFSKKRSGSRIANKKISNNSAKRNFPADFFAKRNTDSRCGS